MEAYSAADIFPFIKAVVWGWFGLMGGVGTAIWIWAQLRRDPDKAFIKSPRLWAIVALVLWFVATFQAWSEEARRAGELLEAKIRLESENATLRAGPTQEELHRLQGEVTVLQGKLRAQQEYAADRKLGPAQREVLLSSLKSDPGIIAIETGISQREPQQLAAQLAAVFEESGWTVTRAQTPFAIIGFGVITGSGSTEADRARKIVVGNALVAAGFRLVKVYDLDTGAGLRLFVDDKPPPGD